MQGLLAFSLWVYSLHHIQVYYKLQIFTYKHQTYYVQYWTVCIKKIYILNDKKTIIIHEDNESKVIKSFMIVIHVCIY